MKIPPTLKPPRQVKNGTAPPAPNPARTFSIAPWTGVGDGEKIVIYGQSGIGKTTLAAMAPDPVFIGIDDGGRKICNPITKEPIRAVFGVDSLADMITALSTDMWPDKCTIVIDSLTKAEEWIQQHILGIVKIRGQKAASFRQYGWDGDRYMLEQTRLLLHQCEKLVHTGRNVILICQQSQFRVANAAGNDYLEDGPSLQHRTDCSAREDVKQWADHVLRIGFLDMQVTTPVAAHSGIIKPGKILSRDSSRAIFSQGAQHFTAKSRPIRGSEKLPPVVSFATEEDNSLWTFMFGEEDGA